MSGVFLTVTDANRKPDASLLQATRGGYPHVTLVYTGKELPLVSLQAMGHAAFAAWVDEAGGVLPTLTLAPGDAYVNTFHEGRTGRDRHDVLLGLSEADRATVAKLRARYVMPQPGSSKFSQQPPHVTHSIHYSRAAANHVLESLRTKMPLEVVVTGYTLD